MGGLHRTEYSSLSRGFVLGDVQPIELPWRFQRRRPSALARLGEINGPRPPKVGLAMGVKIRATERAELNLPVVDQR